MDTSKEYLDMCEESWKDLRSAKISVERMPSLWLFEENNGRRRLLLDFYTKDMSNLTPICRIYRQDQLQEMCKDNSYGQLVDILQFCDKHLCQPEQLTMEQLWLAFVMKEKYNKVWDGKEWIG